MNSFILVLQSADAHICLTWEGEQNKVTFKCKVDKLTWRVTFYNPSNEEQGHCLPPYHHPKCVSSKEISQDRHTNITELTIHKHINTGINGRWKCTHGRNIDVAVINVTVIKEGTFCCFLYPITLFIKLSKMVLYKSGGFCLLVRFDVFLTAFMFMYTTI